MLGGLYKRYVPPKSICAQPEPSRQELLLPRQEKDKTIDQHNPRESTKTKAVRKEKKRKRDAAEPAIEDDEADITRSKQHQHVLAKYDRSIKVSERIKEQSKQDDVDVLDGIPENLKLHDIVPLPQPPPVKREPYRPNFTSLPPWLSNPIITDSSNRKPFSELGLSPKVLGNLTKRSYDEAFPVQATLVPLMLHGPNYYYGDICVSAPTGSGKTLGYVLPLIEHLKDKTCTNLKAIIVVPTRELVAQVKKEAEKFAAGTSIQIGTALGSTNIVTERQHLMFRDQRYDPEAAVKLNAIVDERLATGFMEDDTLLEDARGLLPMHVPDFRPSIDILICTPGRLVEHIRNTTGFSLKHVQHFVIDEADRLLDESFSEWVDTTLQALDKDVHIDSHVSSSIYQQPKFVQKVILSATMTQDLGKLAALRLQRPCLVAVVASAQDQQETHDGTTTTNTVELLELPASLREVAVPVGDGSEKPMYLLKVLTQQLQTGDQMLLDSAESANLSRVLIFTNSNEDAVRLRHLLVSMQPVLDSKVGVLTKITSKKGRKTLNAFKNGKLSMLIASDRASRGLDVPDLTDVISYDMPRSETIYIQRVGRTARAGQSGTGWTLFSDTEARWFWNSIARTSHIRRGGNKVERYNLVISEYDDLRGRYAAALQSLKHAVMDS